jgi:hypothetical protein
MGLPSIAFYFRRCGWFGVLTRCFGPIRAAFRSGTPFIFVLRTRQVSAGEHIDSGILPVEIPYGSYGSIDLMITYQYFASAELDCVATLILLKYAGLLLSVPVGCASSSPSAFYHFQDRRFSLVHPPSDDLHFLRLTDIL